MAQTTNYKLDKPAGSDTYSISVPNGNMDKIDAGLENRSRVGSGAPTFTAGDHKGDRYYDTAANKEYYCNGTAWVQMESGKTYTQGDGIIIGADNKISVDDTREAKKADLDAHIADAVKHITADERTKWNAKSKVVWTQETTTGTEIAKVKIDDGAEVSVKVPAEAPYTAGNGIDVTTDRKISAKVKASGGILADTDGLSIDPAKLNAKEDISNKVETLDGADGHYPTTKAVKDALDLKQDKLPTVVNDKYLHTNPTTGALEWAAAGTGSVNWGGIGGQINDQIDLNNMFLFKANQADLNTTNGKVSAIETEIGNETTPGTIKGDLAKKSIVSVSATGTATSKVKYITVDGTESLVGVDVDSALSETSENPVQNKVINTALNGKPDYDSRSEYWKDKHVAVVGSDGKLTAYQIDGEKVLTDDKIVNDLITGGATKIASAETVKTLEAKKAEIDDALSSSAVKTYSIDKIIALLELYGATFRGSFATKAALDAYTGAKDKNDRAIVQVDETQSNEVTMYEYNGTAWTYLYSMKVNFSTAQWAAIDSGITSELVAKIDVAVQTVISNGTSYTGPVVNLGNSLQSKIQVIDREMSAGPAGAVAFQYNTGGSGELIKMWTVNDFGMGQSYPMGTIWEIKVNDESKGTSGVVDLGKLQQRIGFSNADLTGGSKGELVFHYPIDHTTSVKSIDKIYHVNDSGNVETFIFGASSAKQDLIKFGTTEDISGKNAVKVVYDDGSNNVSKVIRTDEWENTYTLNIPTGISSIVFNGSTYSGASVDLGDTVKKITLNGTAHEGRDIDLGSLATKDELNEGLATKENKLPAYSLTVAGKYLHVNGETGVLEWSSVEAPSPEWGSIGGDIANQVDLQSELKDRVKRIKINNITCAPDENGLATLGNCAKTVKLNGSTHDAGEDGLIDLGTVLTSVKWGDITGDLSEQTDLHNILDTYEREIHSRVKETDLEASVEGYGFTKNGVKIVKMNGTEYTGETVNLGDVITDVSNLAERAWVETELNNKQDKATLDGDVETLGYTKGAIKKITINGSEKTGTEVNLGTYQTKITSGTADPTGGNDGDVYIKYTA